MKSESEVAQSCPTLVTPWTAAYQAPPSMGFSRQEYWSGVPLPSPNISFRSTKTFVSTVSLMLLKVHVHSFSCSSRVFLWWGTPIVLPRPCIRNLSVHRKCWVSSKLSFWIESNFCVLHAFLYPPRTTGVRVLLFLCSAASPPIIVRVIFPSEDLPI